MIYSAIRLDARYPLSGFGAVLPDIVHASGGFYIERINGEDFVRVSKDGHEEHVPWANVKQATPLVQESEKATTPPPPPIEESAVTSAQVPDAKRRRR